MAKNVDAGKEITFGNFTVPDLFQKFYLIPDYQREYVWGEDEVRQLLDDIYIQYNHNLETEFFLGSIVVCGINDSNNLEVIDGQQRLITLSLILNFLRRLLKQSGEKFSHLEKYLYSESTTLLGETIQSYVIDVQYEGKNVLYKLFSTDSDEEINHTMIEGLPGKTIFDAHQTVRFFFEETFKTKDHISDIKMFQGYLLNKVKLIQIKTPDIGNALKIFETINERGVGLDQVDLLKNLLFQQLDRNQFQKLKDEWSKFKESIVGQKEKEKPLRFLRYFIMANYEIEKDKNGDRIIREDDIYEWFIGNEKRCNYKTDPFGFVRNIQESADFYINLMRNRYYKEDNIYLQNIKRLVGSGFKQHFILLLSAKNLKPEFFNHLLKQLEVLLFYYNISKENPRDIEKRFAEWAQEIRKVKTETDLNDFVLSRIKTDIDNRSRLYETNFLELSYNSMQNYKLKYLLAKLTQFIENERTGENEGSNLDFYLKRSIEIEHILPETPTKEIMEDFCNNDKKKYVFHVNKLGNLTLLEKPINASIQRDFFEQKCREYIKSMFYLTKSIAKLEDVGKNTSINRVNKLLKNFSNWNEDAIKDRHQLLLDLSKSVWQITLFP